MAVEAAESKMAKTIRRAKAPPARWNASIFLIRKERVRREERSGIGKRANVTKPSHSQLLLI